MGIPFLNEITKLINEHGSSKILQERIALLQDQFEVLEKQLNVSIQKEVDLAKEIASLKLQNEQLRKQIVDLNPENPLILNYGIFWDSGGSPYCPRCKFPGLEIKWATLNNQQIQGLKCSCSDHPFVLMKNGEAISAQEAMKNMAKQES